MANNAWQEMLPANSDFTKSDLLAGLILRTVYVLGSAEDTQTIDLQTSLMLAKGNDLFAYDSTDTTTSHDGTSCLVDSNGRRYKIVDELQWPASVLDRTGTPPGSPASGDAYLVTSGATGAWAGEDDSVAVYRANAWKFVAPRMGMPLYVEDETAFYHYSAAGSWESGLGSLSISSGTITPVEYAWWGLVAVEDVLNTPPASPTNGMIWRVGTSPTGDFAGHNDKLAVRRSGAWEFVSPYEGARIWVKDTDRYVTYKSSAWTADEDFAAVETEVVTISTTTTIIDILDLGDFVSVEITGVALNCDASIALVLRESQDNGSTFDSTGYQTGASGTTGFTVTVVNPGTGGDGSLSVKADGLNSSSIRTGYVDHGGGTLGFRDAEQAANALRLVATTGSFYSGKLLVKKYRG